MENKETTGNTTTQILGLGDVVKVITNALGFETCDKCEERRQKLNKLFAFTKRGNLISDEDVAFIQSYDKKYHDQQVTLVEIYNRVFDQAARHCACAGMLKKIHEELLIQVDYQNLK